MTIPFLQVRPKSIKLKVSPKFPAQLIGRTGIDVTKQNGNYYIDLDYSEFPFVSVLPAANQYAAVYDSVAKTYVLAPLSIFGGGGSGGIADAPNDGVQYGRQGLAWTPVIVPPAVATAIPLIESGTGTVGSSVKYAREDHVHPAGPQPAAATATPLVESGAGAVGTSVKYAREDHVHPTGGGGGSVANPTATIGLSAVNGTATSSIRSDGAPALSQSITPTWTGTHTFNNKAVINRPPTDDGLVISNALNGVFHYGFYQSMTATGTIATNGANYNLINVTSDNAQVGDQAFGNVLTIQNTFGGAAMRGGRQGLQVGVTLTSPSSPTNPNYNYVAGMFGAAGASHDNGTNTTTNPRGNIFGLNLVPTLRAGATNYLEVSGGEIDIGMDSTASAKFMIGWTIVSGYNGDQDGAGSATALSAGVSVSAIVSRTLDAAYVVGDINSGWPIKTTGSLFKTFIQGATPTITNGIDLTGVTYTGAAFKSPNFQVSPIGAVAATQCSFVINTGAIAVPVGTFQNTHNTAGDIGLIVAAGPTGSDSLTSMIQFTDGPRATLVGQVARSGTGTVYNTSSDSRLKENLRPASIGLVDLMRVEVKDFNFINAPDHVVNGMIAQELQEVYPWAVTKGGDDPAKAPWQIDYGRLTPLLIRAVQELSAKVDELTARINNRVAEPRPLQDDPEGRN